MLYSDLKIFHFPEKIHSLDRGAPVSGPLHLRIKPTNICNHRCYYCCFRTPEAGPMGQTMNEKDSIAIEKLLETLSDFATMGGRAVTFSGGGEPFVYPHLLRAAEHAANSGLQFASLTNGARLLGDVAEFFARYGSWVRVSMDGWDDDSYSRYRGVNSGEYRRILQNMENFVEIGGNCALGVSFNIDKENYPHIPSILHDLKARGIRSVQLSACIVSTDRETQQAYHRSFYEKAQSIIKESIHTLSTTNFEIKDKYTVVEEQYENTFPWCPFLQILTVIGADACVYSCQHKAYNTLGFLGNLYEMRFRTFWEKDKEKFYKITPTHDCKHSCVAHIKNKLILDYLKIDTRHIDFV